MTITEAIETLNKHQWRERDDWQINGTFISPGDVDRFDEAVVAALESIHPKDAPAIASYLLLREACESFVEVAEQIPESDEPVEIAFHGPDPKLFYRAAMNVADWRRLAELAGEKAR